MTVCSALGDKMASVEPESFPMRQGVDGSLIFCRTTSFPASQMSVLLMHAGHKDLIDEKKAIGEFSR